MSNKSVKKLGISTYDPACLKQENQQLKELNKKLVDQKCQLEEELRILKHKERVNNLLLENTDPNNKTIGKSN